MNQALDHMMQTVLDQILALKIPVSDAVVPQVFINNRAKKRLGCCIRKNGIFRIEISSGLWALYQKEQRSLQRDEACSSADGRMAWQLKNVIAHELLHTCYGCGNHGSRWKAYASRMNAAYGYQITRVVDVPELISQQKEPLYLLQCKQCGQRMARYRMSKAVQYPERYRCACGGKIIRIK